VLQAEGIDSQEELTDITALVVDVALTESALTEIFADVILIMRCRLTHLEFSSESSAPATSTSFSRTLIACVQAAYERMPKTFELSAEQVRKLSSEEQEALISKMKTHTVRVCGLIGELFVRDLLRLKVIQHLVDELFAIVHPTSTSNIVKESDHLIECLCHFCSTTGSFLDTDTQKSRLLFHILDVLADLQKRPECSLRINFVIQNLFDAKKANWHKKAHKEKAKSLRHIKEEAERAVVLGGEHLVAQAGHIVKLGERINLSNAQYASYMDTQMNLLKLQQKKTTT